MSRTRYRWDDASQSLVEVGLDYVPEPRSALIMPEEPKVYGDARATDGTPINTRKRHREYMKARGLAMVQDFAGEWSKAAQERADISQGAPSRERREAIGRAIYETQRRSRR